MSTVINKPSCKRKNSTEEITACYRRAFLLDKGKAYRTADNPAGKLSLNTTVFPYWIEGSHCFWYERETITGKTYCLVNATTASHCQAFNHQQLADSLSAQTKETLAPDNLPLQQVDISLDPKRIKFTAFGQRWCYEDDNATLQTIDHYPDTWLVSPDGTKAVFVRAHNLWLKELATGQERVLTQDGEMFYAYAATSTVYGCQELERVEAIWSGDSQRLFTLVRDTRQVNIAPPLVQHVPEDGSLRPTILNPERRVGMPGDEHIEVNFFLAIDVNSGAIQFADYRGCPPFMPPYIGYFSGHRGWWSTDHRHAYFIDLARGGRTGRLLCFDTCSGETKVLIEEKEDYRFTFVPMSHFCPIMMPLPESNEVIWYSERSGWAHLYLIDTLTGELKHSITQGEWLVRNVLRFDAERREVWIQTGGRSTAINPYYCDVCRVNIDTGELTPIISGNHNYVVCDSKSRVDMLLGPHASSRLGVSPEGEYVVTTRSRVDAMPVSVLLDRNGHELLTIETATAPGLPEAWQWPEPIMLKAADGVTDIYAVVFRPSNFNPAQSYPVVDCSWGEWIPTGSFSNSMGKRNYKTGSALAELGFIVVMVLSRGTAMRSKAFYQDKDYSLLFSYHLDDHITAIEQLATRYPYMDLNKVGVVSTGSATTSLLGLLQYPNFYKVGISCNPFSDLSLLGEFYGDYTSAGLSADTIKTQRIEGLADKLQGKLLLIHGMLDDRTPVASTFRLVDAFQKTNKNFDMLILPNLKHDPSDYTFRRTCDYLVRHLKGIEPPKEFDYTFINRVIVGVETEV